MSLPIDFADLTQSAFLIGIPADTWQTMLVSAFQKLDETANIVEIFENILGALLVLFSAYPGDQSLLAYLRTAVQLNFVPLSFAVSFFIRGAPQIQDASTFHLIFKTLVDSHFASAVPLYGSTAAYSDASAILNIVHTCLPLLEVWHNLTIPTAFHAQGSPISQLVVLLLSWVQDVSSVTNADAAIFYEQANQALHNTYIDQSLRHSLENYMMLLSMLLGDDAKAAREVAQMQAIQMSLSKTSNIGGTANLDIITCGMLLRSLFDDRGRVVSYGHTDATVAIFRGLFHYTGLPLQAYLTQLILAALDILSQYAHQPTMNQRYNLWCSFVVSRLPTLLLNFQTVISSELPTDVIPNTAMQAALRDIYNRTDLLRRLEPLATDIMPLSTILLQSFVSQRLVDRQFATSLDATLSEELPSRIMAEAEDHGMDIESYVESNISMDGTSEEDGLSFLNRVTADYRSHSTVSGVLRKRFISLASSQEVEPLSFMCKLLCQHDASTDILSLHEPLYDILGHGLHFIHSFTCEGVGDPQTAISQFGMVVKFMQLTLIRLQLAPFSYTLDDKTLGAEVLLTTHRIYTLSELAPDESLAFESWYKALFGRDSEGIDDTILRSTKPLTLLRIAATLLSEAVSQAVVKVVDQDSLRNGVQFFIAQLLNWTAIGVIKAFVAEIDRLGYCATMHIDVVKLIAGKLFKNPVVLRICAPSLLRMVTEPQLQNLVIKQNDLREIKALAIWHILGLKPGEAVPNLTPSHDYASFAPLSVRRAIELARTGCAPAINVRRCVTITSPLAFLEVFWAECRANSADPNLDQAIFRRISAHILVYSCLHSHSACPPLLPIFVYHFLPGKIAFVGQTFGEERNRCLELLAVIIESSMTAAFHLERSLISVVPASHSLKATVSRLKTGTLALRLSHNLQRTPGDVASALRQRLCSVQSFAATFPEFGC